MDLVDDKLVLEDFAPGVLDTYRKQAKFNWKKLKLFFEDEDMLKTKMKVWKTLESDPIFERPEVELTTDEKKRRAARQLRRYVDYMFPHKDIRKIPYKRRTRLLMACNEALNSTFPDVSIKYALGVGLFSNTIVTLGTDRHQQYAFAGNKVCFIKFSLNLLTHLSSFH
nr:unnamed protein product [Callosobruchus chinensis]